MANNTSKMGTPKMRSGIKSGAKKKYVWLLKSCVAGSARPPTTLVEIASMRPSSNAPLSPMKILAGLKLCGRKPMHAPKVTAATSGPMLGSASKPKSPRWRLYKKKAADAIATIPVAKPSNPSMRLMASVITNNHKMVTSGIQSFDKTNTSKYGTRK